MSENIVWVEPLGNPSGSTAYGTYDNDIVFQQDAIRVSKYCARMLGYPIVDLEIDSGSAYTAFETAIDKYTSVINQFNIINNYTALEGSDSSTDLTNVFINPTNKNIINISNFYGSVVGLHGNLKHYTVDIDLEAGVQKYDLNELISDRFHSGSAIEIQKVYHFKHDTMHDTTITNPWNGDNTLFNNFHSLVMPLSYRLIHLQKREMFNQIMTSTYSFEIINNELTLYPIPDSDKTLKIDYYIQKDLYDAGNIVDEEGNVITGIHNAGFNSFMYSIINQPGKEWIKNMTLAIFKQMLGNIRSKYSSIPIPDGELTLDGESLKSSGLEMENQLVTQLNEKLEYLKRDNIAARNIAVAESLNKELEYFPGDIMIG